MAKRTTAIRREKVLSLHLNLEDWSGKVNEKIITNGTKEFQQLTSALLQPVPEDSGCGEVVGPSTAISLLFTFIMQAEI